jgi:hypothetical protein
MKGLATMMVVLLALLTASVPEKSMVYVADSPQGRVIFWDDGTITMNDQAASCADAKKAIPEKFFGPHPALIGECKPNPKAVGLLRE